jgi:hypothetical protein
MTAPNLSKGLLVVQILSHPFIPIVGKFLILGIEFVYRPAGYVNFTLEKLAEVDCQWWPPSPSG